MNVIPMVNKKADEDSWQRLYSEQADLYEALVQHEDVDENLLPAIAAIAPLAGARVARA